MSYDKENWIYIKDRENKNRFVLGKKGKKTLACFGINPSTAAPDKLDNTVKSVERLAINNGYDSWMMFNVYPQRSTDPKGLVMRMNRNLHRQNLDNLEKILKEGLTDFYLAWGNLIESRDYLMECLKDICSLLHRYNCRTYSIGKVTKAGHPSHPLYKSSDSPLEHFDLAEYINKFLLS